MIFRKRSGFRLHLKHDLSLSGGFSIIELMVIVVIMGIILLASMPGLRRHGATTTLVQSSESIASSLRLARQRAVGTAEPVVVVFDADEGSHYLFEDTDRDGVRDTNEKQVGPYGLPSGVRFEQLNFAGNSVSFLPSGSASQSGDVVLANRNGLAKRVVLNAPTGLVYISDVFLAEED